MATEYKLSYTAEEIDEKLGKIDINESNITILSQEIVEQQKTINSIKSDIGNVELLLESI